MSPDRRVRGPLNATPGTTWTLLVEPAGRTGSENMWLDAALLRAAQGGGRFLRLYRWDPPCLSFGRHEPAAQRYDRARIEAMGLDTVRRPTGGRAVWHHAEVTYAVAAPLTLFGSLTATVTAVHEMIARGLRRLGAAVELAPPPARHPRPSAGACFAAPAGGEILFAGRKLVGSAQLRDGRAFLQHGSILLENGQDLVAQVTRAPAPQPNAVSLREALGRPVTFDETCAAIAAAARSTWPGRWCTDAAPATPAGTASYADPAWTWRR